MSEPVFRFRKFIIRHDRCAMKVGTDGVLLGAWSAVDGCRRILDIGTGSGLVSLMAAQRVPDAEIVAVEIDAEAAAQACENVGASPFSGQIRVVHTDIRDFDADGGCFDCILCNPPYFTEDTLPADAARSLARHSAHLRYDELIASVVRLISPTGCFNVILPFSEHKDFVYKCFLYGLNLMRQCHVRSVGHKPPKRILLCFSPSGRVSNEVEELVLMKPDGTRSAEYERLTGDFYLW